MVDISRKVFERNNTETIVDNKNLREITIKIQNIENIDMN